MNIIEYIERYGDKTFDELELTEIDKLIFSLLSYVEYNGIISNNFHNKKTIKETGDIFFSKITKKEIKKKMITIRMGINVFDKVRSSKRYGDLLLYNDIYIGDEESQFSAVCIEINPKLVYVSFEGTDYLVSGWEENFKMAYEYPVKAQRLAIKYLNERFLFKNCKLIVGGHSKGGNLALVAAMECNPIIRKKIIKVYSYDGPGLRKKQIESKKYRKIKDKYTHIIPNNSIFGLLLRNDKNYIVIKSDRKGIMAHDPTTWQLENTQLVLSELSAFSIILEKGITDWLNKYDDKTRKKFVDALADLFKKNKIVSIMEIVENYKLVIDILKEAKSMDSEVKEISKDLIKILIDYNKEFIKEKIKRKFIKKNNEL